MVSSCSPGCEYTVYLEDSDGMKTVRSSISDVYVKDGYIYFNALDSETNEEYTECRPDDVYDDLTIYNFLRGC